MNSVNVPVNLAVNIELPYLVRKRPAEASAGCLPLLEVGQSRTTRLQLPLDDPASPAPLQQGSRSRLVGYKTFYSRAMVDLGVQKLRPAIGNRRNFCPPDPQLERLRLRERIHLDGVGALGFQ